VVIKQTQITTTAFLYDGLKLLQMRALENKSSFYFFDQETNLYHLSQRYYDPETFSFLSKDPAKADGEESTYQYCGGDPVNFVDLSGLRAHWVGTNKYRYRKVTKWLNWSSWNLNLIGFDLGLSVQVQYGRKERRYRKQILHKRKWVDTRCYRWKPVKRVRRFRSGFYARYSWEKTHSWNYFFKPTRWSSYLLMGW